MTLHRSFCSRFGLDTLDPGFVAPFVVMDGLEEVPHTSVLKLFDFGAFQVLWNIVCGELVEVGPESGNRFELQFYEEGLGALVEDGADEDEGEIKWCNDVLRLSAHEGSARLVWRTSTFGTSLRTPMLGRRLARRVSLQGLQTTASSSFNAELYRMKARA